MAKIKSKRNLKIIAATGVALFSLVTLFTATIAWFALNQTVGSNGMSIKVKKMTGKLEFAEFHSLLDEGGIVDATETTPKTYRFKTEAEGRINYSWGNNSASYTGNAFVMDNYSPLHQEHPLLVIFAFNQEYTSSSNGDTSIKGVTSIEDFLGRVTYDEDNNPIPEYPLVPDEDENAAYIRTKDGKDYYASSSIINFYSCSFDSDSYEAFAGDSVTSLDLTTEDVDKYENFVSINPDDPEDVTFNPNPTIFASSSGDKIQYVATIINYYPEAISLIYSTYLGDDTLEDTYGGTLYFACDWTLEVS